jgi:hypothetical protein
MPRTGDMRESKFLKQSDVGNGVLLTISGCEQHNVAMKGEPPEMKWCLLFAEAEKPFVINSTNLQICESIFGSDNTDDWMGHKLVLYNDPNVAFGGKLVGGIRVRAARMAAAAPTSKLPPAPVAPEDMTDSDIPF